MFTIPTAILSTVILCLLARNFKLHLNLKLYKKDADRWETLADQLGTDLAILQQRGNEATRDVQRQQCAYDDEIQHLRQLLKNKNTEIEGLRTKQSTLTSVKFHARVPAYSGFQKTEFKLGLGPCGLTVETILFEEQPEKFVLTQICTNGERKTFDYYKKDIQGRIEKRWAA